MNDNNPFKVIEGDPEIRATVASLRKAIDDLEELEKLYRKAGGKGELQLNQPISWLLKGPGPLSSEEYANWQQRVELIRKLESLFNEAGVS